MKIKRIITLLIWIILSLITVTRVAADTFVPNANHQPYRCIQRTVVNRFDLDESVWYIIPLDAPLIQFACFYSDSESTMESLATIPAEHCAIDEILGPEESESGYDWSINWFCAHQTSLPIIVK